jgi:hypothetical protein
MCCRSFKNREEQCRPFQIFLFISAVYAVFDFGVAKSVKTQIKISAAAADSHIRHLREPVFPKQEANQDKKPTSLDNPCLMATALSTMTKRVLVL